MKISQFISEIGDKSRPYHKPCRTIIILNEQFGELLG